MLDDQADFSVFLVDQKLYEMNEEMQEHDQFAALLRRLAERQQASTAAKKSVITDEMLPFGKTESPGQSASDLQSVASWPHSNDEEYFDAQMWLDQIQAAAEPLQHYEISSLAPGEPQS